MKLKNKKTGEIVEYDIIEADLKVNPVGSYIAADSLAEFNEEWEDVPEEPKEFYFISGDGGIATGSFITEGICRYSKEIGNYFSSREEAEKAVEKLKAWKRLKDKGFKFNGYEHMMSFGHKQRVYVDWFIPLDYEKYIPDLDLLFGGEK